MSKLKILSIVAMLMVIVSCSDEESSSPPADNSVSTFAGHTVGCTTDCPDNLAPYDPANPSAGGNGYVNGKLADAVFTVPMTMAMSPDDKFLVLGELGTMNIRRIELATGEISTIAGHGYGCGESCPPLTNENVGHRDGSAELAKFKLITGMSFNDDGSVLYVGEAGNSDIRAIDFSTPVPVVSTIAGSPGVSGYVNGPARDARFKMIQGVAYDKNHNALYIADMLNRAIRKLDLTTNEVSTVAGPGPDSGCTNGASPMATDCNGYANGIGEEARFESPVGIVIDSQGNNLYVSDMGNSVIRKIVISTGEVSTYIGNNPESSRENDAITSKFCSLPPLYIGKRNSGYNNGIGGAGALCIALGLSIDSQDNLYMVDIGSKTIRKVNSSNFEITTLAGAGVGCKNDLESPEPCPFDFTKAGNGDWVSANAGYINGSKSDARFIFPTMFPIFIAVNKAGTAVYTPETGAHVIRKIVP